MKRPRRTYTMEQKLEAVRRIGAGEKVRAVAITLSADPAVVRRWVSELRKTAGSPIPTRTAPTTDSALVAELRRQVVEKDRELAKYKAIAQKLMEE